MLGLLGKKKGMTQIFNEAGDLVPVTVLQVGPCTVVQKKTVENDGYTALQIGFGTKKKKGKNTKPFCRLKEVRMQPLEGFEVGQVMTVEVFQPGESVDVVGETKGRGFQGVMKRHGKHGGPDAHGSDFHRGPGSIGMRAWPGRVLKNMKLPGRMGCNQVTIKNLRVVKVEKENNLLLVAGAVPGYRNSTVFVRRASEHPASPM